MKGARFVRSLLNKGNIRGNLGTVSLSALAGNAAGGTGLPNLYLWLNAQEGYKGV